MLGWMSYKLESRLPGKISTTSNMHMIPLKGRKWRGTKNLLDEGEGREWKRQLKTQYVKNKDHGIWSHQFSSVQFSSAAQSCLTLCDPMNCSTPGLPVHHQLPEFTQTHVHRVSDAIQPSHPLSSPFPPALNLSQHQGLFKWASFSYQVAKVLVPSLHGK